MLFLKQLVKATLSRTRRNDPGVFCYICGEYPQEHNRKAISDFVKQAYLAYFKEKLGDQDKSWAPHIVCKTCIKNLRQ